jgi:hypothetical protein
MCSSVMMNSEEYLEIKSGTASIPNLTEILSDISELLESTDGHHGR